MSELLRCKYLKSEARHDGFEGRLRGYYSCTLHGLIRWTDPANMRAARSEHDCFHPKRVCKTCAHREGPVGQGYWTIRCGARRAPVAYSTIYDCQYWSESSVEVAKRERPVPPTSPCSQTTSTPARGRTIVRIK
jgi:hypothetical protein